MNGLLKQRHAHCASHRETARTVNTHTHTPEWSAMCFVCSVFIFLLFVSARGLFVPKLFALPDTRTPFQDHCERL